ncbi:preprotein translocase subunit SecG [Candidatus Woesebacteria bacterium RIFOXYB1_FULL_38_16]|uniref:Protein-export membrane protein SecG n=1 Tax=Candidatus Woesebacteria bacterium RIFOXYB1_FULL_38_16 TaxID=1802538 RepID=A0A1F8CRF5_9BACT|nr:MAG: preprotein translocase subunit SecG [Candidatus Woesebacteria bacterium RIFOXYA1_FULL_38_9]OGM78841.1 MAG: preprotein translocase subunit SecG [Candidatus Woesebacteria bacterium RIFOXYB1_FULL_38_16]
MNETVILGIQITLSLILILLILVQVKGTGFGRVWGISNSFSRRGLEGAVFKLTFVISALFILISMVSLL